VAGEVTVGILAIQGDVAEHRASLESLGAQVQEVRLPAQLDELDGLVIPGGESTTIAQLLHIFDLWQPLRKIASAGLPVWGTCAGMILLARRLTDDRPEPLGLLDVVVSRNAFGRQLDSFEQDVEISNVSGGPFPAVFIRAPVFVEVGDGVQVLARLPDGRPVAVRQGNLLATAFHPELTGDPRFHKLFLRVVTEYRETPTGIGGAQLAARHRSHRA